MKIHYGECKSIVPHRVVLFNWHRLLVGITSEECADSYQPTWAPTSLLERFGDPRVISGVWEERAHHLRVGFAQRYWGIVEDLMRQAIHEIQFCKQAPNQGWGPAANRR
jgi:hypothetical protein